MATIVMKAGKPSSGSVQSTWMTWLSIRKPTKTSAGAAASDGTSFTSGARNRLTRKARPVTTDARPVRAPSPTPAADSM
jgi:hypothetical protein